MITIRDWDELLNYSMAVDFEGETQKIKFSKELTFQIKIKGDSWGGHIDYRGAQYVIELQRAINRIYGEIRGIENQRELNKLSQYITVKVQVVEGCSELSIKLGDVLEKAFENMSGKQKTLILVCAIFCATGLWSQDSWHKHKEKILSQQNEQQTTEQLTSTLNRALDIIEEQDAEKPNRIIINKLSEEDTITFPGSDDELTRKMAKKRYPRKPSSPIDKGFFDGRYTIKHIGIDGAEVKFKIEKDGFPLTCFTDLNDNDIESLSKRLEKALKEGSNLEADLQLFVVYTKKGKVKNANITGLGPKRENSCDIRDVFQNS